MLLQELKRLNESEINLDDVKDFLHDNWGESINSITAFKPEKVVLENGKLCYTGDYMHLETKMKELPFIFDEVVNCSITGPLTSLKTMPRKAKEFHLYKGKITSCEGMGLVENRVGLEYIKQLTSLQGLNVKPGAMVALDGTGINEDAFKYLPSEMSSLSIKDTKIKSLKGIHTHVKTLNRLFASGIKSSILGLLLIDWKFQQNFKEISYYCWNGVAAAKKKEQKFIDAFEIIEPYFGQGMKGVTKAQRELIDADLDDYAEL